MRRSSPEEPGWTRVVAGRGFSYVDVRGRRAGAAERERIGALAVPPAWSDVWVCADPDGHLQAVGTDADGRRQYVYHPDWVRARRREKYERVEEFGRVLGRARVRVRRELDLPGVPLPRACATAFRLLDLGALRIGNDVYADEDGGFGLTSLERRHARLRDGVLHLRFLGKSGVEHHVEVDDADVVAAVVAMRRRRGTTDLLSYREGTSWRGLAPSHVNDHLREVTGLDVSAKDFRTWHGTVVAALALDRAVREGTDPEDAGLATVASRAAADLLGNTPAQARESYVDPRILSAFARGRRLLGARGGREGERAVLRLLGEERWPG